MAISKKVSKNEPKVSQKIIQALNDESPETLGDGCDLVEKEWLSHIRKMERDIPISHLRVRRGTSATDYQREAAKKTVDSVSNSFDWYQFNRLWVVDNGDGTYDITDGGGRYDGLIRKGYTGSVPCNVIPCDSVEEAAGHYVTQNENRVNLPTYNRYRGALTSRNLWATEITDVLNQHGLILCGGKPNGNNIKATHVLRKVWAAKGKEGVDMVVRMAMNLFPNDRRIFEHNYIWAMHGLIREAERTDKVDMNRLLHLGDIFNLESFVELSMQVMDEIKSKHGMIKEVKAIQVVLKRAYNEGLTYYSSWKK